MKANALVKDIFTTVDYATRISALHTAVHTARINGTEPFPAIPGASAEDRAAVRHAGMKITSRVNNHEEIDVVDAATVYVGRALTGAEEEKVLMAHLEIGNDSYWQGR